MSLPWGGKKGHGCWEWGRSSVGALSRKPALKRSEVLREKGGFSGLGRGGENSENWDRRGHSTEASPPP